MSDRPLTIDLNAPVRLADVPDLGRRVLVWWLAELAEVAPNWARGFFPKAPNVATLFVSETQWRIVPWQRDVAPLLLDCLQDDNGIAKQILHAAPNFSLAQVIIVLPKAAALRRRVELPMMSERQLLPAIELQIDRLTPFKSETVRSAVKVVGRDPIEGKLSIDVAITPRAGVDALEQRLTRLGFKAIAIDVEGSDGQPSGFDLTLQNVDGASCRLTIIKVALAAAVLASWLFASAMWDVAREQEVDAWQARIAELRPLAQRSAAFRRQVEALTQPLAVANAHKPLRALASLKELTVLIPDTVQLTEFKMYDGRIELAGLANDAAALISTLEASPLFKDVKFRSPVMRRPETNKDRFEISLNLEGTL